MVKVIMMYHFDKTYLYMTCYDSSLPIKDLSSLYQFFNFSILHFAA